MCAQNTNGAPEIILICFTLNGGFPMLANSPIAAMIPCVDFDRARQFYSETLGLSEMDMPMPEDPDGMPVGVAYQCGGGTMLFVYRRETPTKADHTAAGWMVADFDAVVDDLMSRGVTFDTYPEMSNTEWDARGVASYPESGSKSAWFKDPEGNILAINTMPG
jgi:catechol 2,3-dioxygenase-like lactoylglutathione lyase family enzyme